MPLPCSLLLAALLAAPAAAAEPGLAPSASAPSAEGAAPAGPPAAWFDAADWRAGAALGLELGTGDTSFTATRLQLDAETTLGRLSPKATYGVVVSLGLLHAGGDETVPLLPFGEAKFAWASNLFELVPSGRVSYALGPTVWLHADAGLGLAWTAGGGSVEVAGLGKVGGVSEGLAAVVRLAGGLTYAPSPDVRIGAELVGFNLRFGDGVGTTYTLMLAASHRL
jgi:hypothetical protein